MERAQVRVGTREMRLMRGQRGEVARVREEVGELRV